MIKVRVRYLGSLADITNVFEEEIILEDSSLQYLLRKIIEKYPNLSSLIKNKSQGIKFFEDFSIIVILNGRLLNLDQDFSITLKEGDVIILSPFIAGG